MTKKNNIHIGVGTLRNLKKIKQVRKASTVVILTDSVVKKLWLSQVKKILKDKKTIVICIKSGEQNKTISTLKKIWEKMLIGGADRSSVVVTLGGGVVCDIGGFAAGTFMRGIPVIHIPTTLLAQVDASIGGKTAIDFCGIKNSIGIFYKPSAVIIDVQTLNTLPKRQVISGMAEIIKHSIIADKPFFSFLSTQNIDEIENDVWTKIISRSIEIKQMIVGVDEKEKTGIRKQLNFGHTVGHAIEALSLQTKHPLLHGEAIAIGMVAEVKMSYLAGNISSKEASNIISVLKQMGLPTKTTDYRVDTVMEYCLTDKKNKAGEILWTLPTSIGSVKSDMALPPQIIKKGILAVAQ
jgi:3-dehydroquinate synthase